MSHRLPDNFESMLAYICLGAAQYDWEGGRGRPRTAINDMAYCAVMKAVRSESARPLISYLNNAKARKLLDHVPSHTNLQLFLKRAETRQFLIRAIIHSSDLLAQVPMRKRLHRQVRFAAGFIVFGRSYDTLINEALCLKVAEMTLKCCLYGVSEAQPEMSEESLLAMLREQVPPGLPAHLRDEIYQEMVVAVLDGEMRPDKMRGAIGQLLRRVREFEPSRYAVSIGSPLVSDGSKSINIADAVMAHR